MEDAASPHRLPCNPGRRSINHLQEIVVSVLLLLTLSFGVQTGAASIPGCLSDTGTTFSALALDSLFQSPDLADAASFLECLQEDPLGTGTRLLLLPAPFKLHLEETEDGPATVHFEEATPVVLDQPATAEHWRKLAAFRDRHVAVTLGEHQLLPNKAYTFGRTYRRGRIEDRVVVVIGAEGRTTVTVSHLFPDDVTLRDAYTGLTAFVSFGMVMFDAHENGVILIEEVRD